MRKIFFVLAFLGAFGAEGQSVPMQRSFYFQEGPFNAGGPARHALAVPGQRLFWLAPAGDELHIFDVGNPQKVGIVGQVDLAPYAAVARDVAAYGNVVAVIFESAFAQSRGKMVFFDTNGVFLNQLDLGAAPHEALFANRGQYLLVSNRGFPRSDYSVDPPGSISIVRLLSANPGVLSQNDVQEIDFAALDSTPLGQNLYLHGPGPDTSLLPSENLEPRGLAVDEDRFLLYLSLPENNALARIDFFLGQLDTVWNLPYKDWGLPGQGLAASDRANRINIRPYPGLYALYQATALAGWRRNGAWRLYSANQGAPRQYNAYNETQRVGATAVNPVTVPNRNQIVADSLLGRLQITRNLGNARNPFVYDSLFTFGGRSIALWDSSAQLIAESGEQIEQSLAQLQASHFNSSDTSNQSFLAQSDDLGPEPNAVALGKVDGQDWLFVGLRQMGGFMAYQLDANGNFNFDFYELRRNFSVPASDPQAGDLGLSDLEFIPAEDSPNGLPWLLVSHAVSGSFSLYQLGPGIGLLENHRLDGAVYPNPSQGQFYYGGSEPATIYDAQGRPVGKAEPGQFFDLSKETPGFYLLRDEAGYTVKLIRLN